MTHILYIVIILVGVFCSGMFFTPYIVLHSVAIPSLYSVNEISPVVASPDAKTGPLNGSNFELSKS